MFKLYVTLVVAVEIVALFLLPLVAPDMVVLLLVPIVPLTLVVAAILYSRLDRISYRMRRLSPEEITSYRPDAPRMASPQEISRSIVERATEIRRTLRNSPSKIRVEMCALGYRACANDMITLTHQINEELPNSGPLQRFKLRRARKRATDALSATREALPPGALRATRQEQQ